MSAEAIETFAPIPCCVRGQSFVLGGDPKGKNILYGAGKVVVIRDVENPAKCDVYTDHRHKVTVAKYAPTGNYICSGDTTGKIRIWDTLSTEHRLKSEFRPIAGELRDLCWGPESKRIAVCGQGSELHAACITWDSGNNLGTLNQCVKRANSIDFKQTRPYRLVIGDDNFRAIFLEGPPFKFKETLEDHTRFVNVVRFSPDGKYFATASSDSRVILCDGKTAEKVGELTDGKTAHAGGIYGLCWSPDSKQILTASGDKSAKLWNVESREMVTKFKFGNDVMDQQVGCCWVKDNLIVLPLSGELVYLDRNNPEKPLKVVYGHTKSLTAVLALPSETPRHVSADITGKILWWDTATGVAHPFLGKGHTNKVVGLCYDATNKKIVSAAWDDTVKFCSDSDFDFSAGTSISTDGQPISLFLAGSYVVVLTTKSVVLIKDERKVFERKHADINKYFDPKVIGAYGNDVAIEQESKAIKILRIENDSLVDSGIEIPSQHAPLSISYSPDGSHVAVCFDDRGIKIYNVADGYTKSKEVYYRSQSPKRLAWSPNSECLFSCGIDSSLLFFNIVTDQKVEINRAHSMSFMNDICCMSDDKLLTAGDEGLIKLWKLTW